MSKGVERRRKMNGGLGRSKHELANHRMPMPPAVCASTNDRQIYFLRMHLPNKQLMIGSGKKSSQNWNDHVSCPEVSTNGLKDPFVTTTDRQAKHTSEEPTGRLRGNCKGRRWMAINL